MQVKDLFYINNGIGGGLQPLVHSSFINIALTVLKKISLLQIQPNKRISSESALRHTYFDDLPQQIYELDAGKKDSSHQGNNFNNYIDKAVVLICSFITT